MWTYGTASPGLVADQGSDDNVEGQLNQCYSAWPSPEKAKAAAESDARSLYEDEDDLKPPAEFEWKPESSIDGLKQYRLELDDVDAVYLVHPVRVLD